MASQLRRRRLASELISLNVVRRAVGEVYLDEWRTLVDLLYSVPLLVSINWLLRRRRARAELPATSWKRMPAHVCLSVPRAEASVGQSKSPSQSASQSVGQLAF